MPLQNQNEELEEGEEKKAPYYGELFAQRNCEYGEYIISCKKSDYTMYGQNFVGLLQPNLLGTKFELYNHGFEDVISKQLPNEFLPLR